MNKMKTSNAVHQNSSRLVSGGKLAALLLAAGAMLIGAKSARAATVGVDPTQTWTGYMAWSPVASDALSNGGTGSSTWGVPDLRAVFTSTNLTLSPNTNVYNPTDPVWVNPDGSGANIMTADGYVETSNLYVNTSVTFNFTVTADTLASPYTCVGFIKDFGPGYAYNGIQTVAITAPGSYSVTYPLTGNVAGEIVQYGFETVGPDAMPGSAASLQSVVVSNAVPLATGSTNVFIDSSKLTLGYMNWSPVATDAVGYGGTGASAWGLADLPALFGGANGNVVTLSPNVNTYANNLTTGAGGTPNPYWINADGSGANIMDANLYAENNALAGLTVTFSGYNWTHSLAASTNYTCTAFIKDFTPTYSGFTSVTTNMLSLPANGFFSITMPTTAGDHIQYGFETIGPDANPTNVASLGTVVVASTPPPTGPIVSSVTATPPIVIVGSNALLTATATAGSDPLTYQWRKNGVNIPGATAVSYSLTSVPATAEASYSVVVTDNTTSLSSTGAVYLAIEQPSHLVVDPLAPYSGYLNFFTINPDGTQGSYETGRGTPYSPAGLRASFNNGVAVLSPNIDQWDPNNANNVVSGVSVVSLEGDFLISDDNLSGQTLTFTGYYPSNSLAGTCLAQVFIEDFNSSYTLVASAVSNVVAGQSFTITTPTTAGDHIQYGMRIDGPIENPNNTPDPWGGYAGTTAEVSIAVPRVTASRAGNVISLTFPSENGHQYTVQWTSNLKNPAWTALGSAALGNSLPLTITDTAAPGAQRFYRLLVQ
jgi:hypothetical protein